MWRYILVVALATGAFARPDAATPDFGSTEGLNEKFKETLTNQCASVGATDKVGEVENSVKAFSECVKNIVNYESLKTEVDEAKKHGALDEVFAKYCGKSPQLKECLRNLFTGVAPCMPEKARGHIGEANNVTDQIIDFVCFKDGDRIALFIAEGGPQCFFEKSQTLKECGQKHSNGITSASSLNLLAFNEQCDVLDNITDCMVKSLNTCSNPTPGNMAEAMYKFVRQHSPCKDHPKKN